MNTSIEDLVVGHQLLSYCDWPGKLSTVLFTSGCNLYCPTCHNWGIAHPNKKLESFALDTIFSHIQDKRKWLDGVVISGGEPLLQDSLFELCFLLSSFNLPIKLDTNGMFPEELDDLLSTGYIHTVAMDIKAPYEFYPLVTGKNNLTPEAFKQRIESSISAVQVYPDVSLYFRTTLVPMVNNPESIAEIKSYIPKGYRHRLQAFVPPISQEESVSL